MLKYTRQKLDTPVAHTTVAVSRNELEGNSIVIASGAEAILIKGTDLLELIIKQEDANQTAKEEIKSEDKA